jgi:CrcB protein
VKVALIALAGAVGALCRYGIGTAVGVRTFPWATLGINVAGSFALGLLLHAALLRHWPDTTVIPLAVGFLGAFTTFSTFSFETAELLRDDRAGTAAAYVGLSVGLGLLAAATGYVTARTLYT